VGWIWMLVIIVLVAGGPTLTAQRLMNPRLGIAQDIERNWDKLVNHIREHLRKKEKIWI
jgi:hypothetical protein